MNKTDDTIFISMEQIFGDAIEEISTVNEKAERDSEKVSMWFKDREIIRASVDIEKLEKLNPGVYVVDSTRDLGIFCKSIDFKSDELFLFTDSITNALLEEINLFWDKAEIYKKNNLIHKRGILLEGYPGTGRE